MASPEHHSGDGPEEGPVAIQPEPMAPIEEEEDTLKGDEWEFLRPRTSDSPPAFEPMTQAHPSSIRNQQGYGFKKWLKSMKRKKRPFAGPQRYVYGWPDDEALDESYAMFRRQDQDRPDTSSIASSSILRVVKTASISFTSLSSVNRLRSNTRRSGCHSSDPSGSDQRASIDSNALSSALSLDESAWNRAVQRRQLIREIIETETTYVAGLKSLTDVLSTMIVTRSALHQSAEDLLSLHENILLKLRNATYQQTTSSTPFKVKGWGAKRRSSAVKPPTSRLESPDRKAVISRNLREPVDSRIKTSKSIAAEPSEAAEVAEILSNMLPDFSAYKDYSLKYKLAGREIEIFRKSLTNSESMERGIEALVKSTASSSIRHLYAKQGLTLSDLVMKPIQRVCKYQLFLTGLLSHTPVADCPSSHETINRVLQRVIEVVHEVNRAADDPWAKDRLEKTILLQDLIEFSRESTGERDILRDFGHVRVCGALYVAYGTQQTVVGEYMLFALFATHLVLATFLEEDQKFNVAAMIRVCDIELKPAGEGSGMRCEGTLHSWKIIFPSGRDIFELLVSACSEKEACQWKDHLTKKLADENKAQLSETNPFLQRSRVLIALNPKFSQDMANHPTRIDRRSSSATGLDQYPGTTTIDVIIKGTEAAPGTANCNTNLSRSRSLQTDRNTIILTPKRQDRIRIERHLSRVWTRDIIPYPGMQAGRGENVIWSSAESLIRRFSRRKPFARRGSGSPNANSTKRKKSTDSIFHSMEDQPLNEKDEIELVTARPESRSRSEAEDKTVKDGKTTPGSSYSSRTGGKRKPYLTHDDVRMKDHKPGLRKRLSLSLFGSTHSQNTAQRAAAVGH